ncbi:hypothetical protein BCV70DRAFT_82460 [Testicularia cyperi]|uniref:Uncharacterized protein n=1 Tax=Testicularia cyperi TaxID=1882483 RepID=A0A317XF08_9BASI|nr:hypothetical protein BCV70DRAFT_82460 [Testicularia cyperi]
MTGQAPSTPSATRNPGFQPNANLATVFSIAPHQLLFFLSPWSSFGHCSRRIFSFLFSFSRGGKYKFKRMMRGCDVGDGRWEASASSPGDSVLQRQAQLLFFFSAWDLRGGRAIGTNSASRRNLYQRRLVALNRTPVGARDRNSRLRHVDIAIDIDIDTGSTRGNAPR